MSTTGSQFCGTNATMPSSFGGHSIPQLPSDYQLIHSQNVADSSFPPSHPLPNRLHEVTSTTDDTENTRYDETADSAEKANSLVTAEHFKRSPNQPSGQLMGRRPNAHGQADATSLSPHPPPTTSGFESEATAYDPASSVASPNTVNNFIYNYNVFLPSQQPPPSSQPPPPAEQSGLASRIAGSALKFLSAVTFQQIIVPLTVRSTVSALQLAASSASGLLSIGSGL